MQACEGCHEFVSSATRTGAQVVAPLLRTLVALQKHRVVHRDIKPENIFLTQSLAIKLGDLVRTPAAPQFHYCIYTIQGLHSREACCRASPFSATASCHSRAPAR